MSPYKSDEFHLYNNQGTANVHVRHDPCGQRSEPVRTLYDAEAFRMGHTCPEEEQRA